MICDQNPQVGCTRKQTVFLGRLQYCSSENFDSTENYDISEFPTQKFKIQPFLLNNECNVRWSFCSGITDISVHGLYVFVFPNLDSVLLINDLWFHYILKLFAIIEYSSDSAMWLPVQELGKNSKGTLIFKYKPI